MTDKTKGKTAPKKATPVAKKKAKDAPITPESERLVPPAQVILEETKIVALPLPDPSTGPNAKFPFGVLVRDGSKVYYDRFKTAKERDKLKRSLEKRATSLEDVNFNQAAAPAAPVSAPKGPKLVPKGESAANVESINKRITPGARVDTWRIARSVRVGKPGFFLQGGHEEKRGDRVFFIVGEEEYFTNLHKAKEAQVAKLPPSDDPVEAPTGKQKVN